jgi:hypothetical protein
MGGQINYATTKVVNCLKWYALLTKENGGALNAISYFAHSYNSLERGINEKCTWPIGTIYEESKRFEKDNE